MVSSGLLPAGIEIPYRASDLKAGRFGNLNCDLLGPPASNETAATVPDGNAESKVCELK